MPVQYDPIELRPIGILFTPYKQAQGTPVQPSAAQGVKGRAELDPGLAGGLADLEGFSHLILLFHFHRAKEPQLKVVPFLDDELRGVFATRSPARPTPIGLSIVRLERIEENVLHLLDVDMLDGTPLLDLKPYIPNCDQPEGPIRIGWLENAAHKMLTQKGDNRFTKEQL